MAGANRLNWPRRGSMQVWPRVRAKRVPPRVRTWPRVDLTKLLGFIGYKVGMTHMLINDNKIGSPTKGHKVFTPVTIIECPSMKPISLRFYKKTVDGLKIVSELFSDHVDKNVVKVKNKGKESDFDELKIVLHTQPKLTKIGKKKQELIELGLGGKTKEEKLKFGQEILNKNEIKVSEVFKEGQFLDIHSVTKGKGFQGTVKRFGVKIRQHKSEKTKRGVGTLGSWTPKHVSWRVAQPGKMGYHTRTEFNKWLISISSKVEDINPKGGFMHYGNIKNEFILLKGSVAGAPKKPVVLTEPVRPVKQFEKPEVSYVSVSKK